MYDPSGATTKPWLTSLFTSCSFGGPAAFVSTAKVESSIWSAGSSVSWEQDTFGYADAYDEQAGTYRGLVAGGQPQVLIDTESVVVKPAAVRRQLEATRPAPGPGQRPQPGATPEPGPGDTPPPPTTEPPPTVARRFFGAKTLDARRVSRDADQIATEIVAHLVGLVDANVTVRIEIAADTAGGVPDDVVRTVTENARTLKFDQHGFEEA